MNHLPEGFCSDGSRQPHSPSQTGLRSPSFLPLYTKNLVYYMIPDSHHPVKCQRRGRAQHTPTPHGQLSLCCLSDSSELDTHGSADASPNPFRYRGIPFRRPGRQLSSMQWPSASVMTETPRRGSPHKQVHPVRPPEPESSSVPDHHWKEPHRKRYSACTSSFR